MDIFFVKGNRIAITPEALLLAPIKEIWEKEEEGMALIKLGYVEFMCSHKKTNPFIGYKLEVRGRKILLITFPNVHEEEYEKVMNDDNVILAMSMYNILQNEASPSLRFYNASIKAAETMTTFFTDFDLKSTNSKTGALLYKPADITRALKDVNDVIKTLGAMKEKVIQEIAEDSKGKAGREINHFEKSKND